MSIQHVSPRSGQVPPSLSSLPLAEIFVLCGFYLIYSIEEATHYLINRYAASSQLHLHSHQETSEKETMALHPISQEKGEVGSTVVNTDNISGLELSIDFDLPTIPVS